MFSTRTWIPAFFVVVSAAALAACGGGGGGGGTPPVPSINGSAAPGLSGALLPANVSVKMPVYKTVKTTGASRRVKNGGFQCGECTPSIVFTVNGTVASTVNLTGGNSLYFITIPLPVGADHVVADLYDGSNGGGKKFATGATDVTIAANGTNTVNLSLSPILTGICALGPDGSFFSTPVLAKSSGSLTLYLIAQDVEGNFFSPSTFPSATISASGTNASGVSFSPSTISGNTASTQVSWDTTVQGDVTVTTSFPCTGSSPLLHVAGPYVYVSSATNHMTAIFDQNTNAGDTTTINGSNAEGVIGHMTLPLGTSGAMVFDGQTSTKWLYIADTSANAIYQVNAQTNQYVASIGTTGRPWGLSLSSDGTKLYVSESGLTDFVAVYDATASSNRAAIYSIGPSSTYMDNGSFLNGLTTYPDTLLGRDVTVVAARYPKQTVAYPSLATIDSANLSSGLYANPLPAPSTPPLAAPAFATAYSANGTGDGSLLVRETGGNGVESIDLQTKSVGAATGYSGPGAFPDQYVPAPNALAVNGGSALAVGGSNSVFRFSYGTGWSYNGCISVGGGSCPNGAAAEDPVGVAYSHDGNTAFVANFGSSTISVLDTSCGPAAYNYAIYGVVNPFSLAVGDGGLPPPSPNGC